MWHVAYSCSIYTKCWIALQLGTTCISIRWDMIQQTYFLSVNSNLIWKNNKHVAFLTTFCLHIKNAANLGKCKMSSSSIVNKIFWVSWFWSISITLVSKIKNTRYYYKLLDLEFFILEINLFSITTETLFWDYERFVQIRS